MKRITLTTQPGPGYELLDSGEEEKLERFGDIVLSRPDPQALWEKRLGTGDWQKADGTYVREGKEGGKWTGQLPKEWRIEFGGLTFLLKPTSFKHTGLFPEQLSNWEWVSNVINSQKPNSPQRRKSSAEDFPMSGAVAPTNISAELVSATSVLNLFGYTGGATLAAAKAGAQVTHVDASKTAVAWARQNAELSGLKDAPVRWITEDALTFVQREIKRGTKYDAVIMDPPAFGHGPAGELWKIEEDFLKLIKLLPQLLSDAPLFVLINGYAAGYSPVAFAYNLALFVETFGGEIEYGDLEIREMGSGRVLPSGIFARWKH